MSDRLQTKKLQTKSGAFFIDEVSGVLYAIPMTYILVRVLVNALALVLAAYVIPGIVVENVYIAVIAATILGLLNITVRPLLFLLTLPITFITLGLFAFIVNAVVFLFAASFIDGFEVDGFLPALLGSIFVSLVSAVGNKMLSRE